MITAATRNPIEVAERALALFGISRLINDDHDAVARAWIRQHQIDAWLSAEEHAFFDQSPSLPVLAVADLVWREQAALTLFWALSEIERPPPFHHVSEPSHARVLRSIWRNPRAFRARAKLRARSELWRAWFEWTDCRRQLRARRLLGLPPLPQTPGLVAESQNAMTWLLRPDLSWAALIEQALIDQELDQDGHRALPRGDRPLPRAVVYC